MAHVKRAFLRSVDALSDHRHRFSGMTILRTLLDLYERANGGDGSVTAGFRYELAVLVDDLEDRQDRLPIGAAAHDAGDAAERHHPRRWSTARGRRLTRTGHLRVPTGADR